MAKLVVLCGLQCSGKSTIAKEVTKDDWFVLLSSDQLRKEHPDWDNEKVFKTIHNRMNNLLSLNKNVIIDATNTTVKMRKQIFANLKVNCEKICYIMNTSYEECLKRLKIRNEDHSSHYVPEEVLLKYYYSFEIPFYEEGWDVIKFHSKPDFINSEEFLLRLRMVASTFDQDNMHHTQCLGDHMNTVRDILLLTSEMLGKSGEYHDIGKLFTQTYKPGDPNAHYYNHANVGAYILMCNCALFYPEGDEFILLEEETLDWLFYINYHMHMFNLTTDKSRKKWQNIFGEEKFKNLEIFNEADKKRI